jgi:YidC/Oxa1 family membrane protein insertase
MSIPLLDGAVGAVYPAIEQLAGLIGGAATIVLCTAAIRLLLVPLARAAVRGERERAKLAPTLRELRTKHRDDPARLRAELNALYTSGAASPLAGCLPLLLQAPFFVVWYRVFTTATVAGHANALLSYRLLGAPLSTHLLTGGHALVFVPLLFALAALAALATRRARLVAALTDQPAPPAALTLLPYASVVSAAVLPLAAVLYLVTTLSWTAAENVLLRRGLPGPA